MDKEYITDYIVDCVLCHRTLDLYNCCDDTKLSGLCVECLNEKEEIKSTAFIQSLSEREIGELYFDKD